MSGRVTAIYYQVAEDLKEKIMTGQLLPGEMAPSESQMAEAYGISRMTARQGISLLVDGGYLYSVPGKGYYVAAPNLDKIIIDASRDHFFGQKMKVTLKKVDVITADDTLAAKMETQAGEVILRMQLTLDSREGPVALDSRYLPYRKGEPLLENELQYADFPHIAARHSKVVLAKSKFNIGAILLTAKEAQALETEQGMAALCIEQLLFDREGKPLGWSRMVCRSDRYVMTGVAYPYAERV